MPKTISYLSGLFTLSAGDLIVSGTPANAHHRRLVVPAPVPASEGAERGATPTRARMTWAERLRRVFGIDVSRCARCGAALRVLAVITDPRVVAAILAHLETCAAQSHEIEGAMLPSILRNLIVIFGAVWFIPISCTTGIFVAYPLVS